MIFIIFIALLELRPPPSQLAAPPKRRVPPALPGWWRAGRGAARPALPAAPAGLRRGVRVRERDERVTSNLYEEFARLAENKLAQNASNYLNPGLNYREVGGTILASVEANSDTHR